MSDEQILGLMRRSVLVHGPNVSLDLVAQELDITTPALLKRFGSRQTLMLAALRPPADPAWLKRLAEGVRNAPLELQLKR